MASAFALATAETAEEKFATEGAGAHVHSMESGHAKIVSQVFD
jgi:hypothetical protein